MSIRDKLFVSLQIRVVDTFFSVYKYMSQLCGLIIHLKHTHQKTARTKYCSLYSCTNAMAQLLHAASFFAYACLYISSKSCLPSFY